MVASQADLKRTISVLEESNTDLEEVKRMNQAVVEGIQYNITQASLAVNHKVLVETMRKFNTLSERDVSNDHTRNNSKGTVRAWPLATVSLAVVSVVLFFSLWTERPRKVLQYCLSPLHWAARANSSWRHRADS